MQFAKSKISYEEKKEYGTSIEELKTFSRPNLDDGNRFYEDNKQLREEFGPERSAITKPRRTGFKPYKGRKPIETVQVTN